MFDSGGKGITSSVCYLSRPNLNEKAATFVRNLQHFGPRKAVNSQLFFVNQKATRADTEDDIHALQVLRKECQSWAKRSTQRPALDSLKLSTAQTSYRVHIEKWSLTWQPQPMELFDLCQNVVTIPHFKNSMLLPIISVFKIPDETP